MAFISLHNHTALGSNLRLLDSINRPDDMVEKAISLGYKGMAFTDHEALSSAIDVLKVRDSIKDSNPNFKIIFGNEIYLVDESELIPEHKVSKYFHFILLAKDLEGWRQLRELSSKAWEGAYTEKGIMRVPTTKQFLSSIIKANPGHIFASTACVGGELPTLILDHKVKEANDFIRWCIEVFGVDNFALELQPSDYPEQIEVNKVLIKIAKHYNLPFIVTTDSHYLNKEDFAIHSAFLNSRFSGDRETEKFYKYTYVMSIDEIKSLLKVGGLSDDDINSCINNTELISNKITNFDFRHSTIVPAIKLPQFEVQHIFKDYYDKYPFIKHYAYSQFEQDRFLMYQIEKGFQAKGGDITPEKLERLNTELDVILFISKKMKQDVSAYLNLAADMINIAWKTSLVGIGRGSACGEYVLYLLGVTQLNPMVYNLPYWRFLNKERVEMPDIDSDYQPEKTPEIIKLFRDQYGNDNVLNCITFKTESLKSATLTAARGLRLNNDDAQALAAMVPAHRGKTYTLNQCEFGDTELGFEPVPAFINKLKSYPGLYEAVKAIEGTPSGRGIHASALYIFNGGYLDHNSLMRAPNGTPITAFNMHDSDDMGALKMDVLRTDAQSKIAKCLSLLLKDKQIEWQGSLRATYDKYLHPDVLVYDNPEMWRKMADGEIINLFQFETEVGSTCIKKARPTNVRQLAEINSIMRLQIEGDEQPIDRYVRFHKNIQEWYSEMAKIGLTAEEVQVLEQYLKDSFGVSGSQETLMLLVMDPKIAGYTLKEANDFRKAISKKITEKIQGHKKKYFAKSKELGVRQVFLDYVWKTCIEPQLGYAFSLNHTTPYSVIAVQEANLATRFNPLYWQCACLCINAGTGADDLSENENDESEGGEGVCIPEDDKEEETTVRKVAPNYKKIAKALDDAKRSGVRIALPDINTAEVDFTPDIKHNAIKYSLQAVNVVSDDLLDKILSLRPFTSVKDFYLRVNPTTAQMIGLIKAGCFDELTQKDRMITLRSFLRYLAGQEYPLRDKLTSVHIKKAVDLGLKLNDYAFEIRLYHFRQYIDKNQLDKATHRYIFSEEKCISFFNTYLSKELSLSKSEYSILPDNKLAVKQSVLKRLIDGKLKRLMDYLNSEEGRKTFQQLEQENFINTLLNKYCQGTQSTWEMETMCFYYGEHELTKVNEYKYGIRDFNKLPEVPTGREFIKDGQKYMAYDTYAIAGTVIGTDNNRHIVTLSTTHGVVNVKLYSGTYNQYNAKISVVDPKTNKKTVVDESWFKRGRKIIVYGYRRENQFVGKANKQSGYNRIVCLITNIYGDGSLELQFTRNKK